MDQIASWLERGNISLLTVVATIALLIATAIVALVPKKCTFVEQAPGRFHKLDARRIANVAAVIQGGGREGKIT